MKKETLINDIEITFERLITVLSKFNEKTLNSVPFKGSWTAGQTAEHIIICGDGIPDSQTSDSNRHFDEREQYIKKLFLNFDLKFKADPSLEPSSASHNLDILLHKLREIKVHLKNTAKTSDLEALCRDMELPTFGFLTRYEWLRFIVYHTQRHTQQITKIGKKFANDMNHA